MKNQLIKDIKLRVQKQQWTKKGKVRELYDAGDDHILVVATNDISAFNHIMPWKIPNKGVILNELAGFFFEKTSHIIPNCMVDLAAPDIQIWNRLSMIELEIVLRRYLTGSLWKKELSGEGNHWDINLRGMKEFDRFSKIQVTPTKKNKNDDPILYSEAEHMGLIDPRVRKRVQEVSMELFRWGEDYFKDLGIVLVDTKFEFGLRANGDLYFADEGFTPDSSRYYLEENYITSRKKGIAPIQYSKQLIRDWIKAQGWEKGQQLPTPDAETLISFEERYKKVYQHITGIDFNTVQLGDEDSRLSCIEHSLTQLLT